MTTCLCAVVEMVQVTVNLEGLVHRERTSIQRCVACGGLWKVRYQWDAGTGSDVFCLRPGEAERGITFSLTEAASFPQARPPGETGRASRLDDQGDVFTGAASDFPPGPGSGA